MTSLSWPIFCVLRTFLGLFDARIISRMIFLFYFLMSSVPFLLMVLHISAYSIRCLSRRFVIRTRFGDDNLDLSGLLIALATIDALCWIMYVMVSLMVSMSSSSCSVSNRFSIRVEIRSSLTLFVWHLLLVIIFPFPPLRPV